MLKGKIFEKCQKYFEDYLFGFDQDHMQMSLLTGHIDLNNVNIKPDKINEMFAKQNIPFALKAGLISKLSVDVFEYLYLLIYFILVKYLETILRCFENYSGRYALHYRPQHFTCVQRNCMASFICITSHLF